MPGPFVVVTVRGSSQELAHRAAGPLNLHLAAVAPTALSAPLPRCLYGVLPAPAPRLLDAFLNRFGGGAELAVGIGTPVVQAADLADSRQVADHVPDAPPPSARRGVHAPSDDHPR